VVEKEHRQVVKELFDKAAGVNAQSKCYINALQVASNGGHKAMVKMLLDKGANVNVQGGYYSNSLQAASSRRHKAVIKVLVAWSAKST
jgi:ankyrin repeat protein